MWPTFNLNLNPVLSAFDVLHSVVVIYEWGAGISSIKHPLSCTCLKKTHKYVAACGNTHTDENTTKNVNDAHHHIEKNKPHTVREQRLTTMASWKNLLPFPKIISFECLMLLWTAKQRFYYYHGSHTKKKKGHTYLLNKYFNMCICFSHKPSLGMKTIPEITREDHAVVPSF